MQLSKQQARPLDLIEVSGIRGARIEVRDGRGRIVSQLTPVEGSVSYQVSGAPGSQLLLELDAEGRLLAILPLAVGVRTEIEDERGRYRHLLEMLHDTLYHWWMGGQAAYPKTLRIEGKFYRYYVSWLRDHVHVLKGMKYYDDDLKSGIELYADSQREDGMIWDKCKQMLHSELQNYRDYEFAEGDFIRKIPGNPKRRWQRIPVENDVEYPSSTVCWNGAIGWGASFPPHSKANSTNRATPPSSRSIYAPMQTSRSMIAAERVCNLGSMRPVTICAICLWVV